MLRYLSLCVLLSFGVIIGMMNATSINVTYCNFSTIIIIIYSGMYLSKRIFCHDIKRCSSINLL